MGSFCEGIDYLLRQAKPKDFPDIKKLLEDSGLTTHGIEGRLDNFFVAENNAIIGVIGMEIVNQDVLLRSFAVKHCYRKRGIAENLLKAALDFASERAYSTFYLLTDTAESYFAQRGFIHIERAEIPEPLLSNSGLGCVCSCCSSAMKMGR